MKVLVTGATGFVGSHTAATLAGAGHEVRVLARTPEKVASVLGPHGVEPEVVVGDMTDTVVVSDAVSGCDAVVHAAAQIGVGAGGSGTDANLAGVRAVVGAAIDEGVGRIVYTSSMAVHLPGDGSPITLDTPLAEPLSPYGASKVAAEEQVRTWQAEGHPITTVVLGGVYGPEAPELVNSFTAILAALDLMMFVPPGGTTVIDVRDVAELLTRIVEAGPETAMPRVLAGGHYVTWQGWVDALSVAVGRPVVHQSVTREELFDLARQMAEAAEGTGEPPPLDEEAAMVMTGGVPLDDRASLERFGVELRPLAVTLGDAVAFLRRIGRLPAEG